MSTPVAGPDILGVTHTAPRTVVPRGACDCHTHVFGPVDRYPYAPSRRYTPGNASLASLQALHRLLGIDRVVIVHPSPYAADNRCTADAVRTLGTSARGIAVIDEETTDDELRALHAAGMRGVRVNLETEGVHDLNVAVQAVSKAAARVAPLGWHVQVYAGLDLLAALHNVLRDLPVPVVIDHFGRARATNGAAQSGFEQLLALLGTGRAYVKLSAPYRISARPDRADAAPLARALIAENPERLVWGTDWPHPGGGSGVRDPAAIEPFRPEDDGAALDRLASWAGDAPTLHRILVENPARLYDFPDIQPGEPV